MIEKIGNEQKSRIAESIERGLAVLGIELGSTRIKAVLIDEDNNPVASGGYSWENGLVNGVWTYDMGDVQKGLQSCYRNLQEDVRNKYSIEIKELKSIGISGMMHGYLVLDKKGELLAPFRTWRNNITGDASEKLTELFRFPVPQRWSIAHLYQSVLNGYDHVAEISYLTTLSGYVHYMLTGKKLLGIGDASGMFPVDSEKKDFRKDLMDSFDNLVSGRNFPWKLKQILPEVLCAGSEAGTLTESGARWLDSSSLLRKGIPLCPPEGDAGTGMVATNCVKIRTGNVSAGTSVFAMVVLEKNLKKVHSEIDLVTTPDGHPVAMAHSNNGSSDCDSWISLFGEAAEALGGKFCQQELYNTLFKYALRGDKDGGGLLSYGYLSGEHVTGFSEGRPLFVRSAKSRFSLANFMRVQLFTSLCALRTGLDVLYEQENVQVDEIRGHGGFFKIPEVGQHLMAAATNTPVSIMNNAGEGGAWGIALLASYMAEKEKQKSLGEFLDSVFKGMIGKAIVPEQTDIEGFLSFFNRYHGGLPIEQAAVRFLD